MIRLTHILAAMALMLLAGLLSVKGLERYTGPASVPGLLVLEAADLSPEVLDALQSRWPGASLEWVPAGADALSPFDSVLAARAASGEALILFAERPVPRAASDPWMAVLDAFPDDSDRPRAAWMLDAAARFVSSQTGARGYVLALWMGEGRLREPVSALDRLVEAARTLPSYRRSTVVVLGARDAGPAHQPLARRWCLRIPIGDWDHRIRPGLADLLEAPSR